MSCPKASLATRFRYGERGQALVMVPALLTFLLAASALVVDMGNLYFSYQELLSATQAAAKAAGTSMPDPNVGQTYGNGVSNSTDVANLYSGATSSDFNYHANLAIGTANVSVKFDCVNQTSYPGLNLPPCATAPNGNYGLCANGSSGSNIFNPSEGCNVVQVKETATVQTFFAKVFGVTTLNISATAVASASGGGAIPYHIMMVLDTTKSMADSTDTGCVSGSSSSYTAEQCAQLGVQTLLSELAPCAANYSSCGSNPPVDEVALMVFPGLCSMTANGVTTSSCNSTQNLATGNVTDTSVNSTYAPPDYACPSTAPPIAEYNNNPEYLVLGFQSDYRLSDTAALNWSSNLVASVGAGTNNCGVQAPGGEGTFYAGAIVAAQQYLYANHASGVQDVMILLSDGNASASGTQMGGQAQQTVQISGMSGNLFSSTAECTQAVNAADWAKSQTNSYDNTKTKIYSISYGSETSGCTSGESVPEIANNAANTPCATMAGISSTPLSQYFFSVPQTVNGKTSTVCNGAVPITQLSQVFTTIAGDLTSARLIPNVDF
jgi:hypothetical protein